LVMGLMLDSGKMCGLATLVLRACDIIAEASLARFFQSDLKTGGGTMIGGACGTIAKVTSEVS
jgi:hypothetical protein